LIRFGFDSPGRGGFFFERIAKFECTFLEWFFDFLIKECNILDNSSDKVEFIVLIFKIVVAIIILSKLIFDLYLISYFTLAQLIGFFFDSTLIFIPVFDGLDYFIERCCFYFFVLSFKVFYDFFVYFAEGFTKFGVKMILDAVVRAG
jgi:hypothetical protein